MGIFNWNFRAGDDEQLRTLAVRIAQRCLPEVLQRVTNLAADMSPAESRGYIRTRAAKVVNREIAAIYTAEPGLRPADRARLASLVNDTLVAAVAEQRRTFRRTMAA